MENLKVIFSKNSSSIFKELELHGKFEFQKDGRLLNISQTVVDPLIFSQAMVYDNFG